MNIFEHLTPVIAKSCLKVPKYCNVNEIILTVQIENHTTNQKVKWGKMFPGARVN